jgi:hypothetical protein
VSVRERGAFLVPVVGKRECAFKKSDIIRAVDAVRDANLEVAGVEFTKNGFVVMVRNSNGTSATEKNDWEEK